VKQIRKRLTYANVMSSIAVFLVLGGATAFAASKIGGNEIKGSAISTGKIKKEAVTTSKIKKNSVDGSRLADGAVTTSKLADGAVTGAKLNLSSLGVVPNAASAGNANTVGGQNVQKISWVVAEGTPTQTFFSGAGLTLAGSCNSSGEITVTASTTANNAELQVFGNEGGTFFESENSSFTGPTSIINGTGTQEGGGSLAFGTSSGVVATMTYGFDFPNSFHNTNVGCGFFGQVIFG
jgi:hypothetical protein